MDANLNELGESTERAIEFAAEIVGYLCIAGTAIAIWVLVRFVNRRGREISPPPDAP